MKIEPTLLPVIGQGRCILRMLFLGIAVAAAAPAAAASSAPNPGQVVHCDEPMAAMAIAEPPQEVVQALYRYNLSSPAELIRTLIHRSNCFVVVQRGVGAEQGMSEHHVAAGSDARHGPQRDWTVPMFHLPETPGARHGGGPAATADFILTPNVAFSQSNKGGIAVIEARTGIAVADASTGARVAAAAEGRTNSADVQFRAPRFVGGAAGGGYGNTKEGSLIAAAFRDNYNSVVSAFGRDASLRRPARAIEHGAAAAAGRLGPGLHAGSEVLRVQDQYSPLVEWQQPSGASVKPIHAILIPNGALFFVEPYFSIAPSRYDVPPPALVQVLPMVTQGILPYGCDAASGICEARTLSCSGHALMADGSVFFGGGSHGRATVSNPDLLLESSGISESFKYDWASNIWTKNPNAIGIGSASSQPLRWYPTVTRLADSTMMLTGGYENLTPVFGPFNRSVEVFDPVLNAWTVVSDFTGTPGGIESHDYTHVYQFPTALADTRGDRDNAVLMLGGSAEPVLLSMNGQQSRWRPSGRFRPGAQRFIDDSAPAPVQPNHRSSSAMLPLRLPEAAWGYSNGSIINVGGELDSPLESNIDLYDPVLNRWRRSIPMIGPRHHPSATILPDGRILILAGYGSQTSDHTGYAEYIDPKNQFAHAVGVAHMPEVRGYHSMVVLLPDGRVFVGGGNDAGIAGNEKPNFRYYYPDYMFKKRPEVVSVPAAITINRRFSVLVPHATSVEEVSLLALGAMTHSFDMGQRSVQLRLGTTHTTIKMDAGKQVPVGPAQCAASAINCYDRYDVQAPGTRSMAPPGPYMLFVLDKDRVPSLGSIVLLQP